jgi:signal transduction histidine kinase
MAVAGLLLGCIAILAAANLWYLRRLQSESLHDSAAQAVLDLGAELARNLAGQPAMQPHYDEPRRWEDFTHLVRALRKLEPSLQYVSVSEGDLILFHEDTTMAPDAAGKAEVKASQDVRIGRRLLATGATVVPVLTFTAPVPGQDSPRRLVQVAMLRDAVTRREERGGRVLSMMFRLSILTLAISFGLAVLLVVWAFRHEQERQRRRRDEEHLTFAGILADGIIHDVRNPMSSLRLDLQLLAKEAGKGDQCRTDRITDLAVRACRTMDRVDVVMKEFLYVSKPESKIPERVEINATVRDCLDLLGPLLERQQIRLQVKLDEAPLEITGHSVGIKRALINVLTNARQASPAGAAILVTTEREGGQAVIRIEDEGPGIADKDRQRIFDMFVSHRPDGLGLGLYLAKAAVETSGGRIMAENRPEGGARFVIRIPLAR